MTTPKRTVHIDVSAAARLLGRKGGLATSAKKKKSSAANGKKGGRPRRMMLYRCHVCGATIKATTQAWCPCLGERTPVRMTAATVEAAVRAAFRKFNPARSAANGKKGGPRKDAVR